jgi:hypothetical protein
MVGQPNGAFCNNCHALFLHLTIHFILICLQAWEIVLVSLVLAVFPCVWLVFIDGYLLVGSCNAPDAGPGCARSYYGQIVVITLESAAASLWPFTLWSLVFEWTPTLT